MGNHQSWVSSSSRLQRVRLHAVAAPVGEQQLRQLQPDNSRQRQQRQPPHSCSSIRLQSTAADCGNSSRRMQSSAKLHQQQQRRVLDSTRLHTGQRQVANSSSSNRLQTAGCTQAAAGCVQSHAGYKQRQQRRATTAASTAGCKQAAASCMQKQHQATDS